MSIRQERAVGDFDSGFNCAQAVLAAFCEDYGLDRKTALKIACGLGGGFRSGEICGAVSGAVLVIGLKCGRFAVEDEASKADCYQRTIAFMDAFREKNRSVVCRELLGYDISTADGYEAARGGNLFRTTCVDMVRSAVGLLEELGY